MGKVIQNEDKNIYEKKAKIEKRDKIITFIIRSIGLVIGIVLIIMLIN